MKLITAAIILFIFSLCSVQAQTDLSKIKGKVSINKQPEDLEYLNISKSDFNKISKVIENIVDIIKESSIIKVPLGVDIEISTQILPYQTAEKIRGVYEPIPANVLISLYQYVLLEDGTISTALNAGTTISININWIQQLLSDYLMLSTSNLKSLESQFPDDKVDDFYFEPKIIEKNENYNKFENGIIAVSLNNKPIYVPLTQEEYIKTIIKTHQLDLAELKIVLYQDIPNLPTKTKQESLERQKSFTESYKELAKVDPKQAELFKIEYEKANIEIEASIEQNLKDTTAYKEELLTGIKNRQNIIDSLNIELNSLSNEQKKQQAFYSNDVTGRLSMLTEPNYPGTRALVKINPNFYDKALPKSDVQVMLIGCNMHGQYDVNNYDSSGDELKLEAERLIELYKQLNWAKIYSAVK